MKVKSSLTAKMRNLREVPKLSETKSIDQRWLGSGTGIGVPLRELLGAGQGNRSARRSVATWVILLTYC